MSTRAVAALLSCIAVAAVSACTARPPIAENDRALPQVGSAPDGLPSVDAGRRGLNLPFPLLPGGYQRILNGDIKGHAAQRLGGVSLADCGSACSDASEFDCRSFDYYPRQRLCELSDRTAAEVGGLRRDDYGPQLEHYETVLP